MLDMILCLVWVHAAGEDVNGHDSFILLRQWIDEYKLCDSLCIVSIVYLHAFSFF